jgi:ATP-dependent Lon protease
VLPLPSIVLPGTLITLALDHDAVRFAVDAAINSGGRVLLMAPGSTDAPGAAHIGVVARVPNTGALPSGQPAAIVQADGRARIIARHIGERGGEHAEVELIVDPRPTPRIEAAARELRVVL